MTGPIPPHVAEKAATRYKVNAGGCFITDYSVSSHGYGQIGWTINDLRQATTVHRAAWTHHYGPIPEGLTVDHLCRVRTCVRPEHLRLLTNGANASDNGQVRVNPGIGRFHTCGEELVQGKGRQAYCRSCKERARRARRAARR